MEDYDKGGQMAKEIELRAEIEREKRGLRVDVGQYVPTNTGPSFGKVFKMTRDRKVLPPNVPNNKHRTDLVGRLSLLCKETPEFRSVAQNINNFQKSGRHIETDELEYILIRLNERKQAKRIRGKIPLEKASEIYDLVSAYIKTSSQYTEERELAISMSDEAVCNSIMSENFNQQSSFRQAAILVEASKRFLIDIE